MKFQKTLLAVTLAVIGFGAQAADATGKANMYAYQNAAGDEAYRIELISGNQTLIKSGWYTQVNGELVALEDAAEIAKYSGNLISGGQIDIKTSENKTVIVDEVIGGVSGSGTNVDQNNYWSFENSVTKTTTTITSGNNSYLVNGQLVNYDENGQYTDVEREFEFSKDEQLPEDVVVETIAATVKKDVQIGNLTEEQRTANAEYAFNIEKTEDANVQGLVATIKTDSQVNTSVAAVTGNGLAVLSVPDGADVNLEKGTVTSTQIIGAETKSPRAELKAYDTTDGKRVVEYGNKYFTLDAATQSLTTYSGDLTTLVQVGAGTAEETSGATEIKSVNTGLVSNKNVTYGESVITSTNEGRVLVGSTDPNNANNTSGTEYVINQSQETTTSKNVVTGIIETDSTGKNTYGLQATNIVNDVPIDQTTVTAEGITTTGVISAKDYKIDGVSLVDSINTRVTTAVTGATQVIDAKILEVDQRLTQFNTTATQLNNRVSQLNKRIDEVEEVANRGVAIALAATQQIPQIGAGQTVVFGGVGHYEGESAVSLGLATVFADGRTSLSAAVGVAGGSEVGGRVGLAYVFGGK